MPKKNYASGRKTVVVELPEYIREIASKSFWIINTTTKSDWERTGINCSDIMTPDDLTDEQIYSALIKFDRIAFKERFDKTRENCLLLLADLTKAYYKAINERTAEKEAAPPSSTTIGVGL